MEYSSSRSPSPATIHYRSLVHELQRGHRAAEQLRRRLIRDPLVEDPAPVLSDIDLAEAILNSFNNSLTIATNSDPSVISSRLRFDDCKIEDSGSGDGGGKSLRIRDRRGCYKRRKRGQSWTADADVPAEDCYAWRKYGQKMILNAKFPRNYYRCTHKTDQGCLAIKQVQKISEDPPLYRTTYNGQHTCKNPLKTPQIIIPSSSSSPGQSDSSILLSFDTSYNNINSPFFPPSNNSSMPIKQELPTNTATHAMMNVMMMAMNQSSPSDYNYLSSSDPTTVGSDLAGDVISAGTYPASASPNSLEIDNYINHLDFIQFDCDINV